MASLLPPLFFGTAFPGAFFAALDVAGTYGVLLLFGVIPAGSVRHCPHLQKPGLPHPCMDFSSSDPGHDVIGRIQEEQPCPQNVQSAPEHPEACRKLHAAHLDSLSLFALHDLRMVSKTPEA